VHQNKEGLNFQEVSDDEIFEITYDEALGVAGGPEVDNDPHK